MTETWWQKPREISVLVDNDNWVLPYAKSLVAELNSSGDNVRLCRTQGELLGGGVALFLGCLNIVRREVLAKNKRNLVVHASDLPRGRGFSPWTWRVIEGAHTIPVCLIDAAEEVDAGAVVCKASIDLTGTELVGELRQLIGLKSIELCRQFLAAPVPASGAPQVGEPSYYRRRTAHDSELDVDKTLRTQFNLLRTVDNERYPAFFRLNGATYQVKVERVTDAE